MLAKAEIEQIFKQWDALTQKAFIQYLEQNGWGRTSNTSWKCVFDKGGVILKFDYHFKGRADAHSRSSHTASEANQWFWAKPFKKRHLPKLIAYSHGLLLQEKLEQVCDDQCCLYHDQASVLAQRLRIMDWYNHGWHRGRIVFFDCDSMGTGWPNWLARKRKKVKSEHAR